MRKTPVSHIQREAVNVILSRVSQILQAVAVQVEHAQLQLGFPNPTIDSACEEEATSLIRHLLDCLADELPACAVRALEEADTYDELSSHEIEWLQELVIDAATDAIREVIKGMEAS